jgi:hypothetical protein
MVGKKNFYTILNLYIWDLNSVAIKLVLIIKFYKLTKTIR